MLMSTALYILGPAGAGAGVTGLTIGAGSTGLTISFVGAGAGGALAISFGGGGALAGSGASSGRNLMMRARGLFFSSTQAQMYPQRSATRIAATSLPPNP